MIVYFSGTGNSRFAAKMIASHIGDKVVDAGTFIKQNRWAELRSERPWVFAAPTYAWQLPRIFADFIRRGSFDGSRTAYFVMTCGSEIGNAATKIKELCWEKGFAYHGVLPVVMPENYIAMFRVPGPDEAFGIIEKAMPLLQRGIECIRQGRAFPDVKAGFADRLRSAINPLFYSMFVKTKKFHAIDTCTGCGKCVRDCPMNNISISDRKPRWGSACTHCMACICGCPEEAIEYGKRSRGKPRYQCREYEE